MDKKVWKEQVIAAVDAMAPELIDMSLFLHKNPELSGQEYQAAQRLISAAEKRGFLAKKILAVTKRPLLPAKELPDLKLLFSLNMMRCQD